MTAVRRTKPSYAGCEQGLRWATVTRGVYGYGERSRPHSAPVLRLSEDLPLAGKAVESEGKVMTLSPELRRMVPGGRITFDEVRVLRHLG